MHDPLTLAFTISSPWFRRDPNGNRYHPPLINIWHKDPERRGSDDSCDWFGSRRPMNEQERALAHAIWDAERVYGNAPYYPDTEAWRAYDRIRVATYDWRQRRGFRWHPRWHVHHWRIRVWPVIHAYRWLFLRCSLCGGRIWPNDGLVSDWGGGNVRHVRHEMAEVARP